MAWYDRATRDTRVFGVEPPWRYNIESDDEDEAQFLVFPHPIPFALLNANEAWPKLDLTDRPVLIRINKKNCSFDGVTYSFAGLWGFHPTRDNLERIACGYYRRVPFNQWGVKVEYAR